MAVKTAPKTPKTTKTLYKKNPKVKGEKTTIVENADTNNEVQIVEEVIEPSFDKDAAIADIWDAFVLRVIMNPRIVGEQEMNIFKKYKDLAGTILIQKAKEKEEQKCNTDYLTDAVEQDTL